MKIVFYNHFHLGDIHLSRSLVSKIVQHFPEHTFVYSHKNHPEVLKDITNLGFDRDLVQSCPTEPLFFKKDDVLYWNTWYAADTFRFMNRFGISFDCLYAAFDEVLKSNFETSLADISDNPLDFYPGFSDWSKFDLVNTDSWIACHPERKVFISNGNVLSGQASNFSFAPIINLLSSSYPQLCFIISNKDPSIKSQENVFYSQDIIGKSGFDLNENAYLTTKSNLVVGRSSGSFTFAMNRNNFFEVGQNFLSFSNLSYHRQFWLNDLFDQKLIYKSKIFNQHLSNPEVIFKIIQENLPLP